MTRPLRVFLCHAKEDKPIVRNLYYRLIAEGWMDVWLDEMRLLPGQEWDIEIEKAVEQSDVVIVCLSKQSVDKEGYVQKELRFVLNIADEKPEGLIFIVPLRLDDCTVPRRIRAWQYVDYFPKANQKWAYQRLLESLKLRAGRIGIAIEDEQARIERERKAQEERERLVAQKAEADRLAREKAEANRKAKAERDRIARQRVEERKKILAETVSKIEFKRLFAVGGILVAVMVLFFIGKPLFVNFPASPAPGATVTSQVAVTFPTSTLEIPIITPTPGIGSTITSDGVTMLYVPAGKFAMGSDVYYSEQPIHSVYLNAYYIDKYEVTNASYKRCVDAGKCDPPKSSGSDTRSSYYGNSEFDDYPVIDIDWNMAKAYCEWRGDRLPTEAEWEKAARGTDGRTYPWGNSIDCSFANYYGKDYGADACIGDTTKVGSYESGKSPYGLYDMAGNVWEWVSDWYNVAYYQNSPPSNPLGPDTGQSRVLRGGSWRFSENFIISADRSGLDPSLTNNLIGFRCSRSAK